MPSHQTLFIPNVTTDVGLSPPYNSLFTFFGQFFDHGVDQTVKSGGTVFVPLKADDPLITLGPDGKAGNTGDEVPPQPGFMVLTRAQNQPGPDGILGTADDIQNANNTDSPWVDQSQTYTSHPSHQVFLREYAMNAAGRPVADRQAARRPRRRPDLPRLARRHDGIGTWAAIKKQAATSSACGSSTPTSRTSRCSPPTRTASSSRARRVCRSTSPATGLVEGNLASARCRCRRTCCTSTRRS